MEHSFPVSVYYEDTDFSGRVYHANYLKYFERAREDLLGQQALARLYRDEGIGFVVYQVELKYKEGAVFADQLEVRTRVESCTEWRLVFRQDAWKVGGARPLVEGVLHLVCVDRAEKLTRIPSAIRAQLTAP